MRDGGKRSRGNAHIFLFLDLIRFSLVSGVFRLGYCRRDGGVGGAAVIRDGCFGGLVF